MARVRVAILQKHYAASCNLGKCNDCHFEQQSDGVHIAGILGDVDVMRVQNCLVG